jgi:hypothetical protein
VTRHAEIEHVFRDHDTYSAAIAQAPLVPLVPEAQQILLAGGYKPAPTMVSLDEPAHADDSQTASAGDTGSIRINPGSTVGRVPEGITANLDSG